MRLINTRTLNLEEFNGGGVPPYAILSHTWGDGEVTYQDWHDQEPASMKQGFPKIRNACHQAGLAKLDYLWVDTNCIDKSSSAELSEAINSMFAWYAAAEVCFVYLADVVVIQDSDDPSLAASKWFKRGWTLQELLAPMTLKFFSRDWELVGSIAKFRLPSGVQVASPDTRFAETVSHVTGIAPQYLLQSGEIYRASVALRMSWAASRITTRDEDIAYCLLGLFNVNMPLLYGEGGLKAFRRLQEEILKVSTDQSIFAWEWTDEIKHRYDGETSIIAPSPNVFRLSGDVAALTHEFTTIGSSTIMLTNFGTFMRLPICRTSVPGYIFVALQCYRLGEPGSGDSRLCVPLRLQPQYFAGNEDVYNRVPWPPLPVSISLFTQELHQLNIPRLGGLRYDPYRKFLYAPSPGREQHRKGVCAILMLFPPSNNSYEIRESYSRQTPHAHRRNAECTDCGMLVFERLQRRQGYRFIAVVVEILYGDEIVRIWLEIRKSDTSITRLCCIDNIVPRECAGKLSEHATIIEASEDELVGSRSNACSEGGWMVEMGVPAIDSTGRFTVPVYIRFQDPRKRDDDTNTEVKLPPTFRASCDWKGGDRVTPDIARNPVVFTASRSSSISTLSSDSDLSSNWTRS